MSVRPFYSTVRPSVYSTVRPSVLFFDSLKWRMVRNKGETRIEIFPILLSIWQWQSTMAGTQYLSWLGQNSDASLPHRACFLTSRPAWPYSWRHFWRTSLIGRMWSLSRSTFTTKTTPFLADFTRWRLLVDGRTWVGPLQASIFGCYFWSEAPRTRSFAGEKGEKR